MRWWYKYLPQYQGVRITKKWFWKGLYQKARYGYTMSEIHSLDYTIAKWLRPRIAAFLKEVEDKRFNCPQDYLDAEYAKSMKKGYVWNKAWARIDDKEENRRCWNRALDHWIEDLRTMLDGIDDYLLEDEDWTAWCNKWDPIVNILQNKINNAKTKFRMKSIWNEIGSWQSFEEATAFKTVPLITRNHCAYGYRQKARKLFCKRFESLWI